MSRDIRSFFTVLSKKPGDPSPSVPAVKKTLKRIIDDSDDEDVVAGTPEPVKKAPKKKQKVAVLSSDSEDEGKKKTAKKQTQPEAKTSKEETKPKMKPVAISDVFKKTPIKQSKVEVVPKPEPKKTEEVKDVKKRKKGKKNAELAVHDDEAFEQTLLDLDVDVLVNNVELLDKTIEEASRNEVPKASPETAEKKNSSSNSNLTNIVGEASKHQDTPKTSTEPAAKKRRESSSDGATPKKKKEKLEHVDSGIDPGQEAHEKKRYSAMLYQKYLGRAGPKHHGMKEIPKGKPDCLKNLCFLRTGVLDSLEGEEFETLIKDHGGRFVHSVSKKVNYLVVGEDAGPSKLEKARSYNIPNISEDELFDMILTKSGMEPKYVKKLPSCESEDFGFGSAESSPKRLTEETKEPTEKSNKSPKADKKPPTEKSAEKTVVSPKVEKTVVGPVGSREVAKVEVAPANVSLTDKYKPKDLKSIIGQQSETSNMNKLKRWLLAWHKNQRPEVHKKLQRPSPWAKNCDGAYFKCALLSGPPGVGKTTTATLVARELGLDIVEFNASDTRSKRLLHEEVSQLLSTKTIAGFASGESKTNKNRVLLMDEVDGMAGNEDRGGIQELIQLIKTSSIPIICMCNDRNHQKMRSLVNYCYDLKFNKPTLEQIRGAMMSVCFKESLQMNPKVLSEIIAGTGCDVRQTLNHLALWAASGKTITVEEAEKEAKAARKDTILGPWEVVRKVFTRSEHKDMSVVDKSRLFFYDYSLGPLFVQENYLKVQPTNDSRENLRRAAAAADSISMGDLVDSKIRRSNNWSLLETEAMCASVFPGHFMSGQFQGQINFPSWLGKNSKKNKFKRILGELQMHTRTSASASKVAMKLDYLVPLRNAIVMPLKTRGMEGIAEAVGVMKSYNLLRDDLDSLIELGQAFQKNNPMSSVDSKVKSAFTRTYNKQVPLLPYAPASGLSKKKASVQESEMGDEELVESDGGEEDIGNDAMIKIKVKTAAKAKKDEAGTSKKRDTGKGKKKK